MEYYDLTSLDIQRGWDFLPVSSTFRQWSSHIVQWVKSAALPTPPSIPCYQVQNPELIKTLLKIHRTADPFTRAQEAACLQDIFTSDDSENRHLRKIYHHLFRSDNRDAMARRLQHIIHRCALPDLNGCRAESQEMTEAIDRLIDQIAIEGVFNSPCSVETHEAMQRFLQRPPLDPAKWQMAAEELKKMTPHSPVWDLFEQLEYSQPQQWTSAVMLVVVMKRNLFHGLEKLLIVCQNMSLLREIKKAADRDNFILRVVAETLRLSPVSASLERILKCPVNLQQLGGPDLVVQNRIQIQLYLLARNSTIVGDHPEIFNSERECCRCPTEFLPSLPYLPFGSGRNICPGWWLYKEVATQLLSRLADLYG